ncbi:hypothetical protein ACFRMQ_04040 [Kitasatospora sp. NPDC056783]|uniref:hypothetical protein n=1 Tax=Kitasatospora sp. NPDC056783 TaxID=3345943 RepID=UPI00368D19EC
MTVGRRRILTAVPGFPTAGARTADASAAGDSMFGGTASGAAIPGAAAPALTVRRYIDHALICSACCR